jgi:hypothetical protein
MMSQNEEINRARAILRPSPVRANHEPRWFRQAIQAARRSVYNAMIKRVKEVEPEGFIPRFDTSDRCWGYSHIGLWCLIERFVEEASSMEDWIRYLVDFYRGPESGPPERRTEVNWLDHTGSTTWGKARAWVSEPYSHAVTAENLRQIELIADFAKLHSSIDANSWHCPGDTVRIVFWEKDDGSN